MPYSSQKVVLVTGAARGIGLATAKRFLAEGWRVALLDIEGELLRGAVADLVNPDDTLELRSFAGRGDGVGQAKVALRRREAREGNQVGRRTIHRCDCERPPQDRVVRIHHMLCIGDGAFGHVASGAIVPLRGTGMRGFPTPVGRMA